MVHCGTNAAVPTRNERRSNATISNRSFRATRRPNISDSARADREVQDRDGDSQQHKRSREVQQASLADVLMDRSRGNAELIENLIRGRGNLDRFCGGREAGFGIANNFSGRRCRGCDLVRSERRHRRLRRKRGGRMSGGHRLRPWRSRRNRRGGRCAGARDFAIEPGEMFRDKRSLAGEFGQSIGHRRNAGKRSRLRQVSAAELPRYLVEDPARGFSSRFARFGRVKIAQKSRS